MRIMKLVTFHPSGRTVEVPLGSRIYDAIRAANLPVASSCGADGTCGKCGVRIVQGSVAPATPHEHRVCKDNRVDAGLRLSCMAEVETDLVVTTDYW